MFDTAVLIAQTVSVAAIAAWMGTGVYDNIRYPRNNELFTAQVLSFERMRADYPEEFARVAHRAIANRHVQQWFFRVAVLAELLAFLVLGAGTVALLMALAGTATVETARALALIGATMFTAVWAGFLIIGNYFCYWFCHEGAQNTHYQMTLWGMANVLLLAAV
jgi:predicted small integral membrane protein